MTDLQHREQTLGIRPALVLVDLSVGFTDPASPLGCACDATVAENTRLLRAFRERELPIFFTTCATATPTPLPCFVSVCRT